MKYRIKLIGNRAECYGIYRPDYGLDICNTRTFSWLEKQSFIVIINFNLSIARKLVPLFQRKVQIIPTNILTYSSLGLPRSKGEYTEVIIELYEEKS